MLQVLLPVALIASAIKMGVNTEAMSLVIFPLAIVDVSISMNEAAFTIGFAISPPTLVHGAIGPYLDALTLSYPGINKPIEII